MTVLRNRRVFLGPPIMWAIGEAMAQAMRRWERADVSDSVVALAQKIRASREAEGLQVHS